MAQGHRPTAIQSEILVMIYDNRESWLNAVAAGMAPLFEVLGAPLPRRVRVAIGFTSRGRRGRAIGECWDNRLSGDGHFEIFIRPDLAHAPDAMPTQIAAILAHELVHAAVGIQAGHGRLFKRVAQGLGLVGPMRATTPGEAFLVTVAPILAAAGPLPHARLDTDGMTTAPKKQAARMLKCECLACGYTVRTARKWLETAGPPVCPVEGHGAMSHEALEGGGGRGVRACPHVDVSACGPLPLPLGVIARRVEGCPKFASKFRTAAPSRARRVIDQ